jgi:hypothetical protein
MKYTFIKILGATTLAAAMGYGIIAEEYTDVSGFDDRYQQGRTKNSISSVVAGIMAQKMNENSEINIEVQKTWFPHSKIIGITTPSTINTYMNLTFSHVTFTAHPNPQGQLEGNVDKSEFDWEIKQTGPNRYHVHRWGPKFDSDLELYVKDGKVTGKYIRPGPHFDWDINGTYDVNGNVNVNIYGPVNLGVDLVGKIIKK